MVLLEELAYCGDHFSEWKVKSLSTGVNICMSTYSHTKQLLIVNFIRVLQQ